MGKRKSTPEELDFIFERELIEEDDYADFWERWDDADAKERKEIIKEFTEELGEDEEEWTWGPIHDNSWDAEQDQAIFGAGAYIVRRSKSGRFAKNGSRYQAVRRPKK